MEGKGLSEANFTNLEKQKLGDLPTATQIAGLLDLKQNVLSWDNTPTDGSLNPVTSDGISPMDPGVLRGGAHSS